MLLDLGRFLDMDARQVGEIKSQSYFMTETGERGEQIQKEKASFLEIKQQKLSLCIPSINEYN